MDFRLWFEMELSKVIPPREFSKKIWVNQPNNQQQIDYWQRKNTKKVYKFPIIKDSFIHFTLNDSAKEIMAVGGIQAYSIFAVSCSFGKWFPIVQFDHIIRKKNSKLLSPSDLKSPQKQKKLQMGWAVPNFGEEICAIHFTTNQIPVSANVEEVVWRDAVKFRDMQIIPMRDAIRLLKNTPNVIDNDDEVEYH